MTTSPTAHDTRQYIVLAVRFEPDHTEERRVYDASSIGEALMMAERADAGRASYTYGITPADYPEARGEGIAFNEADGLLLDGADACAECGAELTSTDVEAQDGLCSDCARARGRRTQPRRGGAAMTLQLEWKAAMSRRDSSLKLRGVPPALMRRHQAAGASNSARDAAVGRLVAAYAENRISVGASPPPFDPKRHGAAYPPDTGTIVVGHLEPDTLRAFVAKARAAGWHSKNDLIIALLDEHLPA